MEYNYYRKSLSGLKDRFWALNVVQSEIHIKLRNTFNERAAEYRQSWQMAQCILSSERVTNIYIKGENYSKIQINYWVIESLNFDPYANC